KPAGPPPNKEDFRAFDWRASQLEKSAVNKVNTDDNKQENAPAEPEEEIVPVEDYECEKTVIRQTSTRAATTPNLPPETERTVVTPDALKWKAQLAEEKKKQDELRKKYEEESRIRKEEEVKNRVDLNADATQAISLTEIHNRV